jgi:hypothetical protein
MITRTLGWGPRAVTFSQHDGLPDYWYAEVPLRAVIIQHHADMDEEPWEVIYQIGADRDHLYHTWFESLEEAMVDAREYLLDEWERGQCPGICDEVKS